MKGVSTIPLSLALLICFLRQSIRPTAIFISINHQCRRDIGLNRPDLRVFPNFPGRAGLRHVCTRVIFATFTYSECLFYRVIRGDNDQQLQQMEGQNAFCRNRLRPGELLHIGLARVQKRRRKCDPFSKRGKDKARDSCVSLLFNNVCSLFPAQNKIKPKQVITRATYLA